MRSLSVLAFGFSSSWRITAYPEITPKMEFCPDWRQSNRHRSVVCFALSETLLSRGIKSSEFDEGDEIHI